MEKIKFIYDFDGEENYGMTKHVDQEIHNENGVSLPDVCEMFEDFIKASCFSMNGVFEYFKR